MGFFMSGRVVMHADLDYFYAQCEEREHAGYRGKPLVVCVYSGRTADSGAVSTTNYVARNLGVRSGMPIVTAKRLLRDQAAIFVPVDRVLYERISDQVMAILKRHADVFEQVSIDEAYLDVSRRVDYNYNNAKNLALQIKQEILHDQHLTCSIGVGPNKLVAKVAADHVKPDGLTVVEADQVTQFLSSLPVGSLYGVGKKTERKMRELGITTVGELATFDRKQLLRIFGRSLGDYFHAAAQGIDDEPVEERRGLEQISRMVTLKENTRDLAVILPELERLAEEVYRKVTAEGVAYRSVAILAIMEDLSLHSRSRTLPQESELAGLVREVSKELFRSFLDETPALKVRRVGVKVGGLGVRTGQAPLSAFWG